MLPRRGTAIADEVLDELDRARRIYPVAMRSAHEGFALLDEERCELRDHVHGRQGHRSVADMRREAVQVAAMAIRFIEDVCDAGRGQE